MLTELTEYSRDDPGKLAHSTLPWVLAVGQITGMVSVLYLPPLISDILLISSMMQSVSPGSNSPLPTDSDLLYLFLSRAWTEQLKLSSNTNQADWKLISGANNVVERERVPLKHQRLYGCTIRHPEVGGFHAVTAHMQMHRMILQAWF